MPGSIGRSATGSLRGEIEAVRDAHKILVDLMQNLDERLAELGDNVQEDADPPLRGPQRRGAGCWRT